MPIRYEIVDGDVKIYESGSFILYSDHICELEKANKEIEGLKEQLTDVHKKLLEWETYKG